MESGRGGRLDGGFERLGMGLGEYGLVIADII